MDHSELYRDKITTPEEAVRDIRSGWRVMVGSGCAEPQTLVHAMQARAKTLNDLEVVHLLTLGIAGYVDEEHAGHFRHNAFFIGPNVRQAVREGRADYTPIFLSEIPELIRSGQRPVQAILLQLSPPDRHGYCSMGISVDIQKAGFESAKHVIAEINPRMPRTFGHTFVHVSQIDKIIEVDTPILELPSPVLDEVSVEIGGHVARLVDHGSCLQLGIGAIPDAVLRFLTEKRHLGVHTEMFSDGLLPLIENGAIDNSRKANHRNKTLVSFVMGTRKLYDYVHDNPAFEFRPSDHVNSPRVIAENDNVVAVNSALQVDLTGQVCADSLGYRFYSGIGGQVDFIRGAAMSRGGKPIIALPSTAKGGTISRIVPHLDEGAGVVTSRGDVHYVVTEFGVAYLHGKTIRERALELINIAHPDFRGELLDFVKKKHYVYEDERVWQHDMNPYPVEWESVYSAKGRELKVRPLRPTDERLYQEFFYGHSPETVHERYFIAKKALSHPEAAHLCCVDYERRMAFGAFENSGPAERFVATAQYELNPRTNRAEISLVVREDYRRMGVASYLFNQLTAYARSRGIAGIHTEVLPSNQAMLGLHRALGHRVRWEPENQVYTVRYDLTGPADGAGNGAGEEAAAPQLTEDR